MEVLNENTVWPLSKKTAVKIMLALSLTSIMSCYKLAPVSWRTLTQQAEMKVCNKRVGYSKLVLIHPKNRKTSFSNKIDLLKVSNSGLHQ